MDNLTHSLVGLFLARAGLKKATACGAAIIVLAANAPDIDVVSWFWGRPTWLHWHRNITHSLLGAPVMALLTVAFVALVCRGQKIRWLPAFAVALIGVASHLLLDLTNVYGVRLLLPFSGHWSHLDITPVLDFAIWAILLLGVIAPALSRLVGSEIGETGKGRGNAGWAVAALLLLGAYDYTRTILHGRAAAMVGDHLYNKLAPRRAGAFPTANPLVWRGMVETSYGYVELPMNLLDNLHLSEAVTYYKPPRTPAMQAAIETYPFRMLLEFVQYPLWVIQPVIGPHGETGEHRGTGEQGETRVSLIDLRFGTPAASGFAATAFVDSRNQIRDAAFGLGEVKPR